VPRAALATGISLLRHWPVSDEKIGLEYKVKRMLEGSLLPPERAHTYWNGTFAEEDLGEILSQPLPRALGPILGQLSNLDKVEDDLAPFLWLDQKYYLADDILTKSDRMSMAHSVEVRPPFLDHRMVEFAATLPAKLKIRGSQQKFVLKQLMKDKLPTMILKRKKTGFDIPAHEWLRGPLRGLLEEALQFGMSEYGQLFRREGIEQLKTRHMQRKINVGYHLWGLLILFLWMKKWQVKI
jgi:asparagine synthase (glutamine-hydrolysing)